jgi:hypothetical protein
MDRTDEGVQGSVTAEEDDMEVNEKNVAQCRRKGVPE